MNAKLDIDFKHAPIVGFVAILMAFVFYAPTVFTQFNSLIQIDGKVSKVETNYKLSNSIKGKRKTIIAELKISLINNNQQFELFKNVGHSKYDLEFEKMKKKIARHESVSIWIKRSHEDKSVPTVFQIENNDGDIIYSFEESKKDPQQKFNFLLIMGSLILFFSKTTTGIRFITSLISWCKNSNFFFSLINLLLILFFGSFLIIGIKNNEPLMTLIFGIITAIYIVAIIYYNLKKNKTEKR